MAQKLFEAFFWISPQRDEKTSGFRTSKVQWHYPDDVSSVIKSFRDIPQFCFPDLDRMGLEKVESSRNENFTFTLTDGDGSRFYGICFRGLFQGIGKRHDVSRRPRHCLCIITRLPYFSFFRFILLQVHALSLLDESPGWARYYLDLVFNRSVTGTSVNQPISIHIGNSELPDLFYDVMLTTPRFTGLRISKREVSIVPVLEILGVEKFMTLMSAVMCERRILFIADNVDRLSSTILAVVSMLQPFAWQHFFIPLLPSKLLDYVGAPTPYMIGVRRYLLSKLNNDILGDVLIVDADSGDVRVVGNPAIVDIIGESGSKFKQASESFNLVKAKATGMANIIFGKTSIDAEDPQYSGPRDIIASILSDLRSVISSKPGNMSLQSVASGILRTLPGGKGVDELRVQWEIDSEKIVRDSLMTLIVYLFASVDDYLIMRPSSKGSKASSSFGSGDHQSRFDSQAFRAKRQQLGDSRELLAFTNEFLSSQMFENFCSDRIMIRQTGRTSQPSGDDEEDVFNQIIVSMQSKQVVPTVSVVKQYVQSRSADNSPESSGSDFHFLTFQITGDDQLVTSKDYLSENILPSRLVDRICRESYQNFAFMKIMKTITMRLTTAVAAGSRGSSGAAGGRALYLLRALLIFGPVSVISYSLDLIPLLRLLNHMTDRHLSQQSAVSALEFMSQGSYTDNRPASASVLEILLDHGKLTYQRRYAWLTKNSQIPFLLLSQAKGSLIPSVLTGARFDSKFLKFEKLHSTLKPANARLPALDKSKLKLTVPTKASLAEREEDDDVIVDDTAKVPSPPPSTKSAKNPTQPPDANYVPTVPAKKVSNPIPSQPVAVASIQPPKPPQATQPKQISLLDDLEEFSATPKSAPSAKIDNAPLAVADPWAPTTKTISFDNLHAKSSNGVSDPFASSTSTFAAFDMPNKYPSSPSLQPFGTNAASNQANSVSYHAFQATSPTTSTYSAVHANVPVNPFQSSSQQNWQPQPAARVMGTTSSAPAAKFAGSTSVAGQSGGQGKPKDPFSDLITHMK